MAAPAKVFPITYTVSDWEKWDGDWELIYGQPVAMAAPTLRHQWISLELAVQFREQFSACERARCLALQHIAWEVSGDTVLVPDIVVVCNEDLEQKRLVRAPEMVIEIVSSHTVKLDETVKPEIYAREGVRYLLLVYPEKRVAKVYRLSEGRYLKVGDFRDEIHLFEDLTCPVEIAFDRLWRS